MPNALLGRMYAGLAIPWTVAPVVVDFATKIVTVISANTKYAVTA